jgi:GT2 family glycosyltransferase
VNGERITVSVVSGGDPHVLRDFLRSLYETAPGDASFTVAVTVNQPDGAQANSVRSDAEDAGWSSLVHVRTNDAPRGFAANHNANVRDHSADLYIIANDDIVVLPGALARLLAFMRDPDSAAVGVASPRLLNDDRTVQGATYSFPSPGRVIAAAADLRSNRILGPLIDRAARSAGPGRSRLWAHDRTMLVDSVRGAFMVVRHDAIADVGLMDEISLVGGEELEWHRRMADAGWKVAFVHEAEVVHMGALTVGGNATLRTEYAKGWLNYFQKHGRRADVAVIRLGLGAIYAVRYARGVVTADRSARQTNAAGLRLAARWPSTWRRAVASGDVSVSR